MSLIRVKGAVVVRDFWWNKMKYFLILSLFIQASVFAFDCKEIEGKEYLSPGDSDFQYHYRFEDKKAFLYAYTMSHDVGDHKVKKEKFVGSYSFDEKNKDQFKLNIKVDGVAHEIIFKCIDKAQYMAVGKFSKKLEVHKTNPEYHAFSMIDLWPKESPVIRRYLPNSK